LFQIWMISFEDIANAFLVAVIPTIDK